MLACNQIEDCVTNRDATSDGTRLLCLLIASFSLSFYSDASAFSFLISAMASPSSSFSLFTLLILFSNFSRPAYFFLSRISFAVSTTLSILLRLISPFIFIRESRSFSLLSKCSSARPCLSLSCLFLVSIFYVYSSL
jgi:hypothetical protein